MADQLGSVKHDYIRYANCWEDADVLLEGLKLQEGDRVLSIGSAGDNSFSMLLHDPALVVAVDINEIQLNLIELKRAAFKTLEYKEFLEFLGFNSCADRTNHFRKVQEALSLELAKYWEERIEEIQAGIIYAGKFENYFRLFRTKILPLVHTKKRVHELFREKSTEEQMRFFERKWNSWRWRLLFKIFFSKFVMGRFGRDPEFLKQVKVKVSHFILEQAKNHLGDPACQRNYFLNFIMRGEFGENLPHYAREENFEKIKNNVDRLKTFHGLAEAAFLEHPEFDKFNLSNIFEYMNEEVFKAVAEDLVAHSAEKARFVYWNLMVERRMASLIAQLEADKQITEVVNQKDLGFFYLSVNCDKRA